MAVNIFKLSGEIDVNTGKAEANLKHVEQDAKRTQASLGHLDNSGKKAGQGIASGLNQSASSASRLSRKISELKNELSSMKVPSLNFGGASGGGGFNVSSLVKGNLITSALSAATSGLTDAMKETWTMGIEYNKFLESANVRMTRFFATAKEADNFVNSIEKFAAVSPVFDMKSATVGAQRLLQMKFAASEVIPALTNIGDAVAGVGGGADDINAVTMQMSQMVGKGKLLSEDLQIIAEHGVPVWELLAKAAGVSEKAMRQAVQSGNVDARRGVQGIIAMMGQDFGGQGVKAGNTLAGREQQAQAALEMRAGQATKANAGQLSAAYATATAGLNGPGGDALSGALNQELGKIGAEVEASIAKVLSGESMLKGAQAVSKGGQMLGKASSLAEKSGLPDLGRGTVDALNETFFGDPSKLEDPLDRAVFGGLKSALQYLGVMGKDEGAKAGTAIGQGVADGTATSLQIKSPSRVMMALGADSIEGFAIGFEAGKRKVAASPIDIEKMRAALVADLERLREDPRIKAMLDTIAKAEGTGSAYNVQFGGGRFSDMSDHPGEAITRKMGGKSITSTAAGRYQFLNRTWGGLESQLGLKDFSAKSQDLAAIQLMKQRGMIAPIMKGDIPGALTKGNREWASLPGSPYGQPTKSAETLTTAYNAALEKYNGLMGNTSGLLAQMNSLYDQAAAKLSTLAEQAKAFVGLGTSAPASVAAPKAPVIQQAQTVQGGQLATSTTTAKADVLTLSKDAASATVAMSVPLKEIAPTATTATEALKSTVDRTGEFADMLGRAGKAAGETIDHMAHFKDAFASGFDNMFDDILNGKKVSMKDFGKQLFKGGLSSVISSATGGQASSPGGMLSNMLFGGRGGAGGVGSSGGGGVSFPSTGGFAGGNPAQAALGGSGIGGKVGGVMDMAQNVGGMLSKGGALSKIPGLAKAGGFLGKLPGIGGMLGKLGGLFGMGGGGAAAGAAGAAGGAAGGGGIMGALMPGLMSNPFTAVAGIALAVGVPLLSKLFANDPLKDYKKHIKAEYGIDASKQMLQKVFEIGQSKFGKDAPKRQIETVRLPEVRDMLSEYAGAFMKGGNAKLFDSKVFGDQFSAVNQFKVGMRANGGPVTAGMPYIVGERRAELFVPSSNGRIVPSVDGAGGGGMFGKGKEEILTILAKVAESLDRFQSMPADHVVMTGLKARPGMAAADVVNSFATRDEHSQKIRHMSATR